ncbi:FK506-binding protein 4-like [Eutrema salsugineum]|uniref:FK506-binding protein 4-like n=1 Tax=Eutrema salsugineum TaxID=72664 RepID=UPI000CECE47B|nr:FK506-binding protein 4-like [Eutrema salsugineum]
MVEGVVDSETGNNQIVLWQNTNETTETETEEEENQPWPPVRMFFEPIEEKKPIFWKEICKIDVDARDNKERVNHPAVAKKNVVTENVAPLGLVEQLQSLQKSMDAQFLRISARMDDIDTRLCSVKIYIKETRRERERPGDEEGEVLRNDVEHEHEQGGEKLESLVTTEKAKKQKQPNQKPKKKQKVPEQKEPEQKEPEQKKPEQKETKQKKPEQKEPEMNETELKEAEQKEAEKKEADHKEVEQKEAEQKETEQKEVELLVVQSPYLLRSKEVEPDFADAVNVEVGAGKRKQEQSKLGPNTRKRR